MFVPVTRTQLHFQSVWTVSVVRWGTALAVLLFAALSVAAPDPNQSAEGVVAGESWSAPVGNAPAAGAVASAPAVAPGVMPGTTAPTAPTVPQGPTQATPARARPQPSADEAADADPEALTLFRPHLDPYGTWVDDARYGRVWVPNRATVGQNFSPYVTSGHWALDSEDNWNWVSDYPFGWVVFHYGRWFYSTDYGWAWVPGRTYAPSWVVWRVPTSTYAYVGWAPMPPRYGWFGGGAVWYSSYGSVSYVFCPSDYLFYPSVGMYIVADPFLVSRLGIYTAFYYPPYYYGGYYGGYYGHHHSHYRGGPAGYRPPAYGPPINRTRISPRAVPRERVAADPRAVAVAPRNSASGSSGFGGFQRSPAAGGRLRSTQSLGTTRSSSSPRMTTGMPRGDSSPRVSPRSGGASMPGAPYRAPSVVPTPRPSPRALSPSSSPRPAFTPRPSFAPRASAPTRAPSFHRPSSVSPRAPSFHSPSSFSPRSSPSFGGGRRHR